ncbi:Nonribosomal peptide synthase sidC, partial [Clarias magur]
MTAQPGILNDPDWRNLWQKAESLTLHASIRVTKVVRGFARIYLTPAGLPIQQ